MSTLAVRYETGTGRRFVRHDESYPNDFVVGHRRKTRLDALRERIERDEYVIDPQQLAEAILRRQCS